MVELLTAPSSEREIYSSGGIRPGVRKLVSFFLKIFAYSKSVSCAFEGGSPEPSLSDSDDTAREYQETRIKREIADKAGRLLDTYGDSVLRMAYSYLHNMTDAEDILQDTLIKYMKTGPEFSSEAHEKAWLLRVASNLSKNRLDYNRVRDVDELKDDLTADGREDLSFVWEAVKSLPENYREAIHLFYQEGYSTKEIAHILKRNESTVRSDLKRGRERLRAILTEVYDFD